MSSKPPRSAEIARLHVEVRGAVQGVGFRPAVWRHAVAAGVSPGSVIHHFDSMEGLRAACDEYVAATIRNYKRSAMSSGPNIDVLAALRDASMGPMVGYLAAVLADDEESRAQHRDERQRHEQHEPDQNYSHQDGVYLTRSDYQCCNASRVEQVRDCQRIQCHLHCIAAGSFFVMIIFSGTDQHVYSQ